MNFDKKCRVPWRLSCMVGLCMILFIMCIGSAFADQVPGQSEYEQRVAELNKQIEAEKERIATEESQLRVDTLTEVETYLASHAEDADSLNVTPESVLKEAQRFADLQNTTVGTEKWVNGDVALSRLLPGYEYLDANGEVDWDKLADYNSNCPRYYSNWRGTIAEDGEYTWEVGGVWESGNYMKGSDTWVAVWLCRNSEGKLVGACTGWISLGSIVSGFTTTLSNVEPVYLGLKEQTIYADLGLRWTGVGQS